MNIAGKTPLLRAKKLEQELGVKEIYLKLEGANPFGNKFDRIAEVLVKDALMQNKKIIFVDGSQDYINSVLQFALRSGVDIKIPLFKNERWKRSKFHMVFNVEVGPSINVTVLEGNDHRDTPVALNDLLF